MITQADARALPLRDKSVQCVVTSPPYWGLRDYKLEPLVWGGEAGCAHEWDQERLVVAGAHIGFHKYEVDGHRQPDVAKRNTSASQGMFCQSCGAWRGSLGLEPTPDCGRPFMVLRRDLTDAQRAFVHRRLRDAGLLDAFPYGMGGRALFRSPGRTADRDVRPMILNGEPEVVGASRSPGNANCHGRGPRDEMLGTAATDSPNNAQASDRRASLDGPGQRDGDSVGAEFRHGVPPPRSQADALASTRVLSTRVQSSQLSGESTERQALSVSQDELLQSSRGLPAASPDCASGSSRLFGRSSSRSEAPDLDRGDHTGHNFESTVWAQYILPQDIRQFYRQHLCGGCYVCHIVEIMREVRRVLRDDGTVWLNLGDSYASSGRSDRKESPGVGAKQEMAKPGRALKWKPGGGHNFTWYIPSIAGDIKHKDLVGIPWMVAFALRADGWYLRSDIIWAKGYSFHPATAGSCMPESVRDRPTSGHEYVFLLSKNGGKALLWRHALAHEWVYTKPAPDYGWRNQQTREFVREAPIGWPTATFIDEDDGRERKLWRRANLWRGRDYYYDAEAVKEPNVEASASRYNYEFQGTAPGCRKPGGDVGRREQDKDMRVPTGRNLRSVWLINPKPYSGAHFATFPETLVEPCLRAGSRRGALVLDPFVGSGTVVRVAYQLGRRAMGCDLNLMYLALARVRLSGASVELPFEAGL